MLPFSEFDPSEVGRLNSLIMALLLIFARMQAFFSASPFFGGKALTRTLRGGLILGIAGFSAPTTAEVFLADTSLADIYLVLAIKELIIGYLLGFMTWLPMRGMEFTGVILDTQRGSMQAMDFDVIFNAQTTPTAIFLSQIFSGYFFAAGGFLIVQTLLFESLQVWPPQLPLPAISERGLFVFLKFGGALFLVAFVLSLPICGFMLLADITIAFLAKSAPTLNALTLGMPVKSAIMLIMLLFYIQIAFPHIFEIFQYGISALSDVFVP